MWPGAGLRVALEAERRHVGAADALQTAVEQGAMGSQYIVWQAGFGDGKTVVLTADHDAACGNVLYRMVGAVMAKFHFLGFCPAGKRQQLMA